jgi:hypothetical protein
MGLPLATVTVCAPRRHCVADENLSAFSILISSSFRGWETSFEKHVPKGIGGGAESTVENY